MVVSTMYPRVKRVRRGARTYEYLQLVEGRRDGAKVRQRVVANLGRLDELKASGQLDRWAGSWTRLDPPAAGTRRQVGPLLLVRHYLDRLGLAGLVDRAAPMRGRAQLTHGEVIAALVANRLSAPSPLYDVAGWASSAAMAELFDIPAMLLNDDRLGRALEALAPVAEHVRGELALAAAHRGGADLSRLHLDLTAVRFAGAYEDSSLVQKGWAADRSIARQVRTLQASNPQGVAVYLRPHTGSRSELPCFAEALDRLRELAPPGLVVVADSGVGYLALLCAADRAGLRFVVPLRADTGWAHAFTSDVGALDRLADLDYCSARQQRLPPVDRTVWRGLLRPFAVTDPDTGTHHDLHVAYIWSSEEATSVAGGRARALQRAEAALAKVRNGLGGRYYKTRKQVDTKVAKLIGANLAGLLHVATGTRAGKPTLTWHRDSRRSPPRAASTGSTPWPPTYPATPTGRVPPWTCCASTKTSGSWSNATAISNRPSRSARSSCTTTTASPRWSPSSASPCSPSASTPNCPACSAKAAPPNPPVAASSPPSTTCTSPTLPPGPSSTGSPPPSGSSAPTSTSPSPGPRRATDPPTHTGRHHAVRKTRLGETRQGAGRRAGPTTSTATATPAAATTETVADLQGDD